MIGAWLDPYDRRARLRPALLSALPFGLSLLPLVDGLAGWWTAIVPVLGYCGGASLLAQLARDRGKRAQDHLFASWGGSPTTLLLRHRDAPNPVTLARHHRQIARLLPDLRMPTAAEEAADPVAADQVYETATKYLRDATRDRQAFPLIYAELCNYGFRRNLLGLRGWALAGSAVGAGLLLGAVAEPAGGVSVPVVGALAIDALAVLVFATIVTPKWVKIAACEYAERLLGAIDHLPR